MVHLQKVCFLLICPSEGKKLGSGAFSNTYIYKNNALKTFKIYQEVGYKETWLYNPINAEIYINAILNNLSPSKCPHFVHMYNVFMCPKFHKPKYESMFEQIKKDQYSSSTMTTSDETDIDIDKSSDDIIGMQSLVTYELLDDDFLFFLLYKEYGDDMMRFLLFQIMYALYFAGLEYLFQHNDFHPRNVMYISVGKKDECLIEYKFKNRTISAVCDKLIKIIDPGLSTILLQPNHQKYNKISQNVRGVELFGGKYKDTRINIEAYDKQSSLLKAYPAITTYKIKPKTDELVCLFTDYKGSSEMHYETNGQVTTIRYDPFSDMKFLIKRILDRLASPDHIFETIEVCSALVFIKKTIDKITTKYANDNKYYHPSLLLELMGEYITAGFVKTPKLDNIMKKICIDASSIDL